MFDDIPAQVWLLIAVAAIAYAPGLYVYRYLAPTFVGRDITLPPEDSSWRTPSQLTRCVVILIGLALFAVFIFTPAAAQFAHSPAFLPILMAAMGLWVTYTVPKGLMTGRIEPMARGFNKEYDRKKQPKRYWASLTWNAILGCMCLWLAYATIDQDAEDKCYDRQAKHTPREELSACQQLIQKRGRGGKDYADLLAARGFAYHRMGNFDRAVADYDDALKLNSEDSYALYNRALIRHQRGQEMEALADYTASLKLRPDNFEGFRSRGELQMLRGKIAEAVDDFSQAHRLKPEDPSALALRGLSYALLKDKARAVQDFRAVKASNALNAELQKGLAIMGMKADDL